MRLIDHINRRYAVATFVTAPASSPPRPVAAAEATMPAPF